MTEQDKQISEKIKQFTSLGTPNKRTWRKWCARLKWIFPTLRACHSNEKGFVCFSVRGDDHINIQHNEDILFVGMDYDGWECCGGVARYFVNMGA